MASGLPLDARSDEYGVWSERGATRIAVIHSRVSRVAPFLLIRERNLVPLSRTWRLSFFPSRPTDVRHFSPGWANAHFRASPGGSLPAVKAPRARRPARGTVAAARGVTAAPAARVGAAAVRHRTSTAHVRVLRELTEESLILIRNVWRHFEREMADSRRILLKEPAECAAVATRVSRRTVKRVIASGAAEPTHPAGTPERQKSLRRNPREEYARVRGAVNEQYRDKKLPRLDSTLQLLIKRQEGATGSGSGWSEQSVEDAAMDAGGSRTSARPENGERPTTRARRPACPSAIAGIGNAGAGGGGRVTVERDPIGGRATSFSSPCKMLVSPSQKDLTKVMWYGSSRL